MRASSKGLAGIGRQFLCTRLGDLDEQKEALILNFDAYLNPHGFTCHVQEENSFRLESSFGKGELAVHGYCFQEQ